MTKINKLTIFRTLVSNNSFLYSIEESIIGNALIKEEWLTATPVEKQIRRNQFLLMGKKIRTVINLEYYEKMILVYDLILEMFPKLEKLVGEREAESKSLEMPLLRIIGLVLVEKDFIDEYIVPIHHIRPMYFQNISNEFHIKYPDLNLKEFAEKYTDMFETWPEKTKYEIKKS